MEQLLPWYEVETPQSSGGQSGVEPVKPLKASVVSVLSMDACLNAKCCYFKCAFIPK